MSSAAAYAQFSAPGLGRILYEYRQGGCDAQQLHKKKDRSDYRQGSAVVSTGYNGTPRGAKNCNEAAVPGVTAWLRAELRLMNAYVCHGEENAITQAAYHGTALKGSTLYTTFAPCSSVLK